MSAFGTFLIGFCIAGIIFNIQIDRLMKRKADEYYDVTNLDDSDNDTVHSRRSRYH
ncbi:hypothetical protein [Listeria booriae]|uniref:hypothetical protein n=1 Tax=Listeria booriae TaxID=1552123 RepID=UPI00162AAF73|nr:hypothetical protein [Listeria booriae]MBC2148131.1 hypothetical protein [Listeria booriae]